jgi:CheY-like chemotaxis protein
MRRVLIVDDNVDSAESMAMLIRSWGHEANVAHSAMSALEIAERFAPETALLDIGLPDMDGYALARRLRAQDTSGNLQLVAMTGYGRAEDRAAARDAGFDVHLVKPAEADELARVLATGR